MEQEIDGNTDRNQYTRYSHQRIGKGAGRIGNESMNEDHPNYNIIKINRGYF